MDPPTAVIDAGCYKLTVVIEVEEFAVEICQIQEISDAAGRTLPNREPYIDAFRNTADPSITNGCRLRVDLRVFFQRKAISLLIPEGLYIKGESSLPFKINYLQKNKGLRLCIQYPAVHLN